MGDRKCLRPLPQFKDVSFSLTWMAFLTPLSNQRSSLSSTRTWLFSKECPLSSSCPEELARQLIRFLNVQFIAFFLVLYDIDDIALFVSWCFALEVDQFLSEGVGGFELHRDVMFLEDSPEFF